MGELIHKEETFSNSGCRMLVHRELGKRHDEVIYKEAPEIEFQRMGVSFKREAEFKLSHEDQILRHRLFAGMVLDKILLETKAIGRLPKSHIKQRLNHLAASKLNLGLLVNSVENPFNHKRVVL